MQSVSLPEHLVPLNAPGICGDPGTRGSKDQDATQEEHACRGVMGDRGPPGQHRRMARSAGCRPLSRWRWLTPVAPLLSVLLALFSGLTTPVSAVLRFPDEYYDQRWPLHYRDCTDEGRQKRQEETSTETGPALRKAGMLSMVGGDDASDEAECFAMLKKNMAADLDCKAVTPNDE